MTPFTHTALPARVIFGFGALDRLAEEVSALGCRRALVLATPAQAETARDIRAGLGALGAEVFAEAAMHTPVEITEKALLALRAAGADCTVAIGGGSTIGLGKALALRTDQPQIVVPTTYAGSEATPILGQTESGRKTTLRDPRVLPETIIYDVALTLSLPVALSVTSGINAIAHAVEALYAQSANPVTSALAMQGIAALAGALPRIVADPGDRDARSDALFGAWACGTCLGSVGMALHHKLCHVLGGSFDLPHAETHTVILPNVAAFNRAAAPDALARVAAAMGVTDAADGLFDLAQNLGAPTSLRALGMKRDDLDAAAEQATTAPYWNPRPVDRAAIRALLDDAWHGRRPSGVSP